MKGLNKLRGINNYDYWIGTWAGTFVTSGVLATLNLRILLPISIITFIFLIISLVLKYKLDRGED